MQIRDLPPKLRYLLPALEVAEVDLQQTARDKSAADQEELDEKVVPNQAAAASGKKPEQGKS